MKRIIVIILGIMVCQGLKAQILTPVHWSYAAKKISKTAALILIKASIDPGWHIYSVNQEEGGPVKTSFDFTPAKDYALAGKLSEPEPLTRFEEVFHMKVRYFEGAVVFSQKVSLRSAHPVVRGKLSYMTCNDQKCLPPEELEFSVPVK